jgi:hypothetical protein
MSDNEQDFDALRRLLALKRHEVPPPGYFEDFSGNVIARIRADEAAAKLPWVLRFLQMFESRPAYPVVFASSLCMLLLYGIVSVEQNPEISGTFAQQVPGATGFPLTAMSSGTPSDGQPMMAIVSTNPPVDVSANASLFSSSQPSPYFQQAGYSPGAN